MAKSHQRRSSPTGETSAETPSTSTQPTLDASNSDALDKLGTDETLDTTTVGGTDADFEASWWSAMLADEEVTVTPAEVAETPGVDATEVAHEVTVATSPEETAAVVAETAAVVEEAVEEGPKDVASRPDKVRRGMKGAVIKPGGGTIEVREAPEEDAAVAHSIPDGTPVKVTSTKTGRMKISFRVGKKKETGWVSSALFSDQPTMTHDDDNHDLFASYTFTHTGKDETTDELAGSDVQQGYLGDCYFIAAMNAVGSANGDFLEQSIQYDASTGMYKVRFYEESGVDRATGEPTFDEVWIEVDGYLPTTGSSTSGSFAGAATDKTQWGAIMEKAHAKWKGGYDVIGEGGYEDVAMEELAGARANASDPQSMTEDEVLAFFRSAEKDGLAIACGSHNSRTLEVQTPLSGSESGPYAGTIKQNHDWNHVMAGSLQIVDSGGKVANAWDTGAGEDKKASIEGPDVDKGEITYESNQVSLSYEEGKAPEKAKDLEVSGQFKGMIYPAKGVIGEHAYSFDKLVGDKIQLYNPWGSYQPKALTAGEFLEYYGSLSTVQVPEAKTSA